MSIPPSPPTNTHASLVGAAVASGYLDLTLPHPHGRFVDGHFYGFFPICHNNGPQGTVLGAELHTQTHTRTHTHTDTHMHARTHTHTGGNGIQTLCDIHEYYLQAFARTVAVCMCAGSMNIITHTPAYHQWTRSGGTAAAAHT